MNILEINDKNQWENFVTQISPDSFLHSWNWGEFNQKTGEKIWRLGFMKNESLVAVALVILVKARRGKFLFIPHGPIIKTDSEKQEVISALLQELIKIGKEEKVAFIRISPLMEDSLENKEVFKNLGFKDAPIHMMHPETTWILDITKDEEVLMKEMRKTHRNLIRRAQKEGVEISQDGSEEFLKKFYDIHMETVKRHKFIPFSYQYIQQELNAFAEDNQISVFLAKYAGEIISSAIIVFYGDEAFYHHGASSSKYAKVPSSYLTLFEAIREARRRGLKKFNFYGIVDNKPKHPWYGLSTFKKGFGGYESNLVHCQDFPLNSKYILTYLVETIRKIKRGY